MGLLKMGALAVGVGVIYISAQHAETTVPAATSAASTSAPAVSGDYSCHQLEQLWDAEGGNPGAAFTAAEVATAESSGDPGNYYNNTNGTTDRGLWQINSSWGNLSTYDPAANARSAIEISHNGTDWQPWVTFQTGKYEGQC